MLNMKKGLALVLAAATAFTFAPVASLDAFAGSLASTSRSVLKGQSIHIDYASDSNNDQDVLTGSVTSNSTNSDSAVAAVASNGKSITVTGSKATTTPIEYKVKDTSGREYTFNISVDARSQVPDIKIGSKNIGAYVENGTYVIDNTVTGPVSFSAQDGNITWTPDPIKVTKPTVNSSVTVTGATIDSVDYTKGDSTIEISGTKTKADYSGTEGFKYTINLRPVSTQSYLVVEGKKTDNSTNNLTTTGGYAKTVEVTKSANTYQINASIDNAQSGDKVTYAVYNNVTSASAATAGPSVDPNEVEVSDKGLVTVKAKGFEQAGANHPYYVRVENKNKGQWALVTIVPAGSARTFTTLSLDVNGETATTSASYDKNGVITDGTKEVNVVLSSKDKKTLTLNPNPSTATITSSNPAVVKVNGTTLEAQKAGVADVTVKADSTATTYGIAKIVLHVTVSDKYADNQITAPDSITLTNNAPKATIGATAKYKNTLTYSLVKKDDKGNWVAETDTNVTLNSATGVVEYKKNSTSGTTYVKVYGSANAEAEAPTPKYVTVKYQPNKDDSNLTVSTPALSLKAGETGDIKAAATGTSISYVSYAPEVATVDAATGKVTAVSKGTAVVAVNAAETDTMKAGQKLVYVTVDNGKIAAPAKVAGLKVTNAKGAKVNVSWTSQGKNIQYRVYKKVGNGKWVAKNVTKGKASLSVKKGAKVQVKVKAFVKDQNGKTVWGPKATKKTFKTDNK